MNWYPRVCCLLYLIFFQKNLCSTETMKTQMEYLFRGCGAGGAWLFHQHWHQVSQFDGWIFMGTAVWGFLAPFCLNFSFVLMPGWNLRDLVAAICNVYFVVFVCQFIWCFMCLQHFWRLPFEAPVLCLFIKLILVGHWGHFYLVFCLFASRVCFLIRVVSAQSLNQLRIKSWCLTSMIVYNICAWG